VSQAQLHIFIFALGDRKTLYLYFHIGWNCTSTFFIFYWVRPEYHTFFSSFFSMLP